MIVDKLLPITFTGWDVENKANDFVFWNVHFVKDFGPWKADEFCSTLKFLLSEGKIEEVTQNGTILKSIEIGLYVIQPEQKEVETVVPELVES